MPRTLAPLLRSLLLTQVLCVGVAALLWLLGSNRPLVTWLYSAVIGTCCWSLIDGGRVGINRWLRRRHPDASGPQAEWPGWRWMGPVVLLGGLFGYVLGSLIADAITGNNTLARATVQWRGLAGVLAISMLATLAMTWIFWARSRLAAVEAAAADMRRQASEAQLKLLETQLEPHMLFNTLANLRVLIGLDASAAQAMLDRLIAYLRATLGASRTSTQPLSAEMDRLRDYLALMAVRMGPRLAHHIDLPAELADLSVPSLLLQPLVENAITHGLEPKVRGGRVEITAARHGGRLVLTVRDTGLGPKTDPSSAHTGPTAGSGFGTQQVRERLATMYGGAASFRLEAVDDDAEGGTRARVEIPLPAAERTPPPSRTPA